jgi:hypothetical protein
MNAFPARMTPGGASIQKGKLLPGAILKIAVKTSLSLSVACFVNIPARADV